MKDRVFPLTPNVEDMPLFKLKVMDIVFNPKMR